MPTIDTARQPGQPYCGNCGYDLEGLTQSAQCPECGRPLVEVLQRGRDARLESGRRYRSAARIFGLPAIDVAIGPRGGELRGRARGFVAIGDDAAGILAIGGTARGVVAIGGAAVGVFSAGGFAVGLLSALGGGAVSCGLAVGGAAIGAIAKGGGALGVIADGGGALGVYARGGGAFGRFVDGPTGGHQQAVDMFNRLDWLLGPRLSPLGVLQTAFLSVLLTALLAGVLALMAWNADRRHSGLEPAR